MVALRATASNAVPEAKAEKRQANSLTNTLPMCPLGMEKQLRLQCTTSLYAESNRDVKADASNSLHINWELVMGTNAERVLPPGLAKGIPSGREVVVDWRTAASSHAKDTRLDDNAGGLTEVDIEESTDVTAVDGAEPGKSWTFRRL